MDDPIALFGDCSHVGRRDPDGDDGVVAELEVSIERHLQFVKEKQSQSRPNRSSKVEQRTSSQTTAFCRLLGADDAPPRKRRQATRPN
jgi:hypothetical protein